jgi:hypothetical protein
MKRLSTLILLLVLAGTARADLIPPGFKPISHAIQVNNLKDHADYVFYVYPKHTDFARAAARFEPDKTVSVSDGNPLAYGKMRFYAVPKRLYDEAKGEPREDWFNGKETTVLVSPNGPAVLRNIRKSDRTERVVTEYEVAIEGGKLTVKQVAEKRYDGANKEISRGTGSTDARDSLWYYFGVPAVAAVMIALVLLLRAKPAA